MVKRNAARKERFKSVASPAVPHCTEQSESIRTVIYFSCLKSLDVKSNNSEVKVLTLDIV